MKFLICLSLFATTMFGGIYYKQDHFDAEKMACKRAGGRGSVLHSDAGIPVRYECMRMHLVLKFRNGEYK